MHPTNNDDPTPELVVSSDSEVEIKPKRSTGARFPQSHVNDDDSDDDRILFDLPEDEGVGAKFGLTEIEGGIGVDSCASDNVMSRKHLRGYAVKPSEGSRKGQRWGSASGHSIPNEGEVSYRFMVESGDVARGTTQVGEVRRPLAAVSKITKANNICFFSQGEDWIIDKKDPLAEQILELVQRARLKTRMYEHKGTYRMRAWLIPENADSRLCGRPGR